MDEYGYFSKYAIMGFNTYIIYVFLNIFLYSFLYENYIANILFTTFIIYHNLKQIVTKIYNISLASQFYILNYNNLQNDNILNAREQSDNIR